MLRPDLNQIEQRAIGRAVKAAGARFGLVLTNAGVGGAATQPAARVIIEIDSATGFPVEPDVNGLYYPGDYPNDTGKELS